jgi:catechol 2,3-dioxygenase-like lactoylglutathione lyase family enzyme
MSAELVALDHLQLAIPAGGEDAARRFWALFGLSEVAKPAALAVRGGCWFTNGAVTVHVGVDPAFVPATKAHPAFIVSSLAATKAVLAAAGVAFRDDHTLEGIRRGYVDDPFGNRIELIEQHMGEEPLA